MTIKKLKLIEIDVLGANNERCDDGSCGYFQGESECFLYHTPLDYKCKNGTNMIVLRCKECIDEFGGVE